MTVHPDGSIAERAASSPRPLDVLFLTRNYYPHSRGGAENQAQLQAEALVRRGHRVTVVCPVEHGADVSTEHNGVRIIGLPIPRLPAPIARLFYTARLISWVALHVRRFHLLHIHALRLESNFVIPLARLLRRPVYLKLTSSGSGGEWHTWRRDWRRPLLMVRWATRVQALTAELADQLVAAGVPGHRVVHIGNGIDLARFHPVGTEGRQQSRRTLGLPETGLLVLYCGTLQPLKGTPELLAAWQRLACEVATLVLVGKEAQGYHLPPASNVIVRPWQLDVAPYYEAADVFVLPSLAEGMSNALLEAMASGIAVVATRVGAAESLIRECEQGLLVAPGDVGALASALQRLIADEALRKRLATEAPNAVSALNIEAVARQIEAVYLDMLGGDHNWESSD